MTTFGFFLSCEGFSPAEILEQARLDEEAGFDALWISDHCHPWTKAQGESVLVWSMIGAISQVCDLPVTTAVTCPTMRIHPAIIAQAAATSAVLLGEGKFRLGLGSGEALNKHILGNAWRPAPVRLVPGNLAQVFPTVAHFEQASTLVTREKIAEVATAGCSPEAHVAACQPFLDAGFDEIYVANMGPRYADMIRAYGAAVLPALRG